MQSYREQWTFILHAWNIKNILGCASKLFEDDLIQVWNLRRAPESFIPDKNLFWKLIRYLKKSGLHFFKVKSVVFRILACSVCLYFLSIPMLTMFPMSVKNFENGYWQNYIRKESFVAISKTYRKMTLHRSCDWVRVEMRE